MELALLIGLVFLLALVPLLLRPSPHPPLRSADRPFRAEWRVAVVSSDPLLADQLSSSLDVVEVKVIPPGRALDAIGYDLVVLGWDVLPTLGSNRSLAEALVRSGRLLLVAEPGVNVLEELLSALVKPVRVGEKPSAPPITALVPVYEENGKMKPGVPGSNLVLVETWPLGDGRLGAGYWLSSFSDKQEVGRAVRMLLWERYTEHDTLISPQYRHIGNWISALYPITGLAGEVGETHVIIKVAYCTNCLDPRFPHLKKWLIYIESHTAKTWSGYSLPVKALTGWQVEPCTVTLDVLTQAYPGQRVDSHKVEQFPWVTWLVWEEAVTDTYSPYYGMDVASAVQWRWGLKWYDGSGAVAYSMGGYAEAWAPEPLVFEVRFKANAYLWRFFATSGEHSFRFAAYTDHLEYLGGG
ncbi:MAG: hypothetical protein ABWK01_03620 [Infirmifilum sp.]